MFVAAERAYVGYHLHSVFDQQAHTVPVTKENYLDVGVLLYNLDQEQNKTKWQFQLLEPHVFTEAAVPLLKEWNRAYTKKVTLHDINISVRGLFDCL